MTRAEAVAAGYTIDEGTGPVACMSTPPYAAVAKMHTALEEQLLAACTKIMRYVSHDSECPAALLSRRKCNCGFADAQDALNTATAAAQETIR